MRFFFRILLGLIIISFFLPPFVALPLTPQASYYFPFWVTLALISYPQIALNTGFIASFSFIVLHIIYVIFGLYQNNEHSLYTNFWPLAFSFSVLEYFKLSGDRSGFKILFKLTIVLILITSISSIISLSLYPYASRSMAGNLASTGQFDLIVFYMYIGIGNYYFFHNLAFCVPIIMILLLDYRFYNVKRWKILLMLTLNLTAVVSGGFSSAFGIFFIGLIFSLFLNRMKTIISYFLLILSIYATFSIIAPFASPILYTIANVLDSEIISPRLRNVGANLDGSSKNLDDKELIYTESYEKQLDISLKAFQDNPLTGSGIQGGHHFWADILGKFGLIGFIPWFFILFYLFRTRTGWFSGNMRIVWIHILSTFIFIGFFKPIGLEEMFSFVVIFLPGFLIYLQDRIAMLNTSKGTANIKFFKKVQTNNLHTFENTNFNKSKIKQ